MSRRKIRLMRALVNGILAALALLALGSLPSAVAEVPGPGDGPHPAALLPLGASLQHQLVLTNPLLAPAELVRTVVLPDRAPLALPHTAQWQAHLDPAALVLALRTALETPVAPPSRAARSETEARNRPAVPAFAAPLFAAASPVATPPAAQPRTLSNEFPVPRPIAAAVDLDLTAHHSLVVQSPVPLKRVSITDDSIAQAVVVSPTQVLVQGRNPGEVSLLLWDADANARAYTVRVKLDPQPLQNELNRLYPRSGLDVSASGDALVVSGRLANAATAKQVMDVAGGFSKNIINNLTLDAAGDPAQVLLQVRFAEVDRSAISQFGANLISTGLGKTPGSLGTGQFGGATGVIAPANQTTQPPGGSVVAPGSAAALISGAKMGLSDLLNVFLFRSDANIGLTMQALEQQNLLQILAEPNLVAMDGKEATFLAGGEFPFPVVQGQGAVNNVTIQFKPFGVNLHFKPTILPDGTIDLQVAPEVSALDFSNALTVSGFLIPALSTRRAETELELNDGQSFVIAGLMDNRLTKNISKLPGLGDIPILGKFFTSHNTSKSNTELVVVVTAHLVHPSASPAKGPKMPQPFLQPGKFDRSSGGGH
ncbi:MAG TPA: pilus assembly protein N-terminal domain-containing protein [Terriglobales bacterium]|jgi:pilus assembly protein CpaC